MLERYATHFENLDDEQAKYLAAAIQKYHELPYLPAHDTLFAECTKLQLDQAGVIMSLARDTTTTGVVVIETLVGQPITRTRPPEVVKPTRSVTDKRVITHVVPNPKRVGSASHTRFAAYKVGMTVDEAVAAGVRRTDIPYDTKRGFITLGDKNA